MKSPEVVFIIIGCHPVKEVLSSLLTLFSQYPIVVVNNGNVGQTQWLGVEVVGRGKNLGFAGGANFGMKLVFEKGATWVVICNQDLVATIKSIEKFATSLQALPHGIVGPFAGSLDSKRWTTILPSKQVDYISGACMAIHRKVIEKIGFFYEPYFMYYEDTDFCIRAKKAGFPIIHIPIEGIEHDEEESVKKGTTNRKYYSARNHLLFVKRNAPLSVQIHEVLRMPKTIWEHYKNHEIGALEGIKDFAFGRFGKKEETI